MQLGWLGRIRFIPLLFVGMIHALPALSSFLLSMIGFLLWLRGQSKNHWAALLIYVTVLLSNRQNSVMTLINDIYACITVYLAYRALLLFSISSDIRATIAMIPSRALLSLLYYILSIPRNLFSHHDRKRE